MAAVAVAFMTFFIIPSLRGFGVVFVMWGPTHLVGGPSGRTQDCVKITARYDLRHMCSGRWQALWRHMEHEKLGDWLRDRMCDSQGEGCISRSTSPSRAAAGSREAAGPPPQTEQTVTEGAARHHVPGLQPLAPLAFRVSWVRLFAMGLLAALFGALGVVILVASPGWGPKIVGLVSVLFFGGGFAALTVKKLRDPIVLELSVDGMKPQSGGFIPWEDFEAVGIGRIKGAPGGTKVIGIRLKSYEGYLASLTPEQIRLARATAVAGKFTGSVLRRSAPGAALRRSNGGLQPLASLPQRDISGMLEWSRAVSGGWDLTFSPQLFRGSARSVVRRIEAYYLSALIARSRR